MRKATVFFLICFIILVFAIPQSSKSYDIITERILEFTSGDKAVKYINISIDDECIWAVKSIIADGNSLAARLLEAESFSSQNKIFELKQAVSASKFEVIINCEKVKGNWRVSCKSDISESWQSVESVEETILH